MKTDVIITLESVMDYCHAKWGEAAQESPSGFPTEDVLTGKKMAYNDVLQFARKLLADQEKS